MLDGITIEICAGNITDVITASQFEEVDRIELNCALELGGLTPSFSTFQKARSVTDKKLIVMVRTRTAGFVYNDEELAVMKEDARLFLDHGADGIVFGFLNPDHTIDEKWTADLIQLIHSYGRETVFHKAFDLTPDKDQAAQTLIELGCDRILTSGGQPDVMQGSRLIRHLVHGCGSRIAILPGGGITPDNVLTVLKDTGCTEIHMSAKAEGNDSGRYFYVSEDRIRRTLNTLHYGLSDNRRVYSREDDFMLKDPDDRIR
jgi:copper homeostasis protein